MGGVLRWCPPRPFPPQIQGSGLSEPLRLGVSDRAGPQKTKTLANLACRAFPAQNAPDAGNLTGAHPALAPPLAPPPLESYAEKNSGLESGSAAASGRSFGPCEPPSGAALFHQRELRRRQEPASAWLKSTSRPHHGRAWPGAGVYDPGPAGAGQVGPGRRLTCSPFPGTHVPAPIP